MLDKMWPVDFIWSSWPIVHVFMLASRSPGFDTHRLIICALTTLWGLRLTFNFIIRGGIGHEDWRYADQRTQMGSTFTFGSLFSVFVGQSMFMYLGCLSYFPAMLQQTHQPFSTVCGTIVTIIAILLEATADRQMDAFIANVKLGKKPSGSVMRAGLWAWSRHPNYLGEWMFWLGMWIFGGCRISCWSFAGPIAMLALFLGVSIDLMEVRQLKRRGDEYKAYIRDVPRFFPLLRV
jgi:steroid 5-alpha reductase family enzyme